jgi:hypothetical protein
LELNTLEHVFLQGNKGNIRENLPVAEFLKTKKDEAPCSMAFDLS